MEIKNNKKAFAFSFLAIFLSFLIFGFAYLYLYEENFSQDNVFKNSRINNLNEELVYFRDTYAVNVLSFSLQNIFHAILENKTVLESFDQNYTNLNLLVEEALLNGSFYGIPQTNLENKTLDYFLKKFQTSFNNNHKGNFSYQLTGVNIHEKSPLYLTAQIDGIFNLTTIDNITTWNFKDSMYVSFPVYNLNDPEFILHADITNYNIRPAEDYISTEWTLDTFKESLNNGYANIYAEPTYDYPIGTSFLNRLLNITPTPYYQLIAFWNFEKDEKLEVVYDSSLNNENGEHFGNSYLLLSFFDQNATDISDYGNNATILGAMNCSTPFEFNYRCDLDGIDDMAYIPQSKFNLNFTNQVSISAWVNPNQYIDYRSGTGSEIFRYGGNANVQIGFRFTPTGKISLAIGSHVGGIDYSFKSRENVSLNTWSHLVGTFDGNTGIGKIYINGRISNIIDGDFEVSQPILNFLPSNTRIGIGNTGVVNQNESLNGSLDELAVYSKALSDNEVAQLFEKKRVQFIDYKDTYHGRGIEFDGIDDYVKLNMSPLFDSLMNETFTVETWFKPQVDEANLLIWDGELALAYTPTKIYLRDNLGNGLDANYNLEMGKNYYLVTMRNNATGMMYIYLNGIELNSGVGAWNSQLDGGNITLGSANIPNIGPVGKSFKGIIDEVRISNKLLNQKEILRNYHNFNSESKGCCNYITLINPNAMGFNQSPYNETFSSYSSKFFFEKYNFGKNYNVTLYNISNITSDFNNLNYTNFLADICILEAYSIFSFNHTIDPALEENVGEYNFTCSNLISNGIY